ncbi:MAG: dihydrodipicolinate reductase [Dehalococcoidia bacterium]|nr:dihydrodipicolinate reductase [Dehalococcoidia bacterium]
MSREIRAVHVGLGPMGLRVVQHVLTDRKGVRYVGAVDVSPDLVGRDLGELAGASSLAGLKVSSDAARVFQHTRPDIAIYTTVSSLKDFLPQTEVALKNGVNVISTCEELAFPAFVDAGLTETYDKLCRKNEVSMLGTGINPGFLMDLRATVLSAACTDVKRIEITRRMDATPRRKPFQRKIGAGMEVEAYMRAMESGEITGHVGLEMSICLIADALGWKLDAVRVEGPEPVIAREEVSSEHFRVANGQVKGTMQEAVGIVAGENRIRLNFSAFLGAQPSFDEVVIVGTPEIRARVSPCWHGDYGTVAMAVNLIPAVINARPGLLTINDIVPVSFKSGNLGNFVTIGA